MGARAAVALLTAVRVLALDYGSARCGVALSDPTGVIATPLESVKRPDSGRGIRQLLELVATLEADRVVVGLPLRLAGGDSDQTRAARRFARRLQKLLGELPVELYDERFTTVLAQRDREIGGDRADEDSRAAAHLLSGWLERNGGH